MVFPIRLEKLKGAQRRKGSRGPGRGLRGEGMGFLDTQAHFYTKILANHSQTKLFDE